MSQNKNEMKTWTDVEQSEIGLQTNGERESIFSCIGSHVGAFDLLSP